MKIGEKETFESSLEKRDEEMGGIWRLGAKPGRDLEALAILVLGGPISMRLADRKGLQPQMQGLNFGGSGQRLLIFTDDQSERVRSRAKHALASGTRAVREPAAAAVGLLREQCVLGLLGTGESGSCPLCLLLVYLVHSKLKSERLENIHSTQ